MATKKKARDYLLIVTTLLALIAVVTREALEPELTDVRDSLAGAEAQFSKESDQSILQAQILNIQQQMEVLQPRKPGEDYSGLIAEDTALAQQFTLSLDADFQALSKLVDALPAGRSDVRRLREEMRTGVEAVDKNSREVLAPKSDYSLSRYALVVSAKLFAIVEHIPMVIAGDAVQTAARQVIATYDALIRICIRTAYSCGAIAAGLAVYSVVVRRKTLG